MVMPVSSFARSCRDRNPPTDTPHQCTAVVVAAKSTTDSSDTAVSSASTTPFPPDPNSSESTIDTVAREIRESGGEATALPVDVRDPASVEALVARTAQAHGRLDALVYNAGAAWWASVEDTPLKRFRLLQQVNVEGLYSAILAALPHLKEEKKKNGERGGEGRIVVVSPPIYSRFFRGKTGYAMVCNERLALLFNLSF